MLTLNRLNRVVKISNFKRDISTISTFNSNISSSNIIKSFQIKNSSISNNSSNNTIFINNGININNKIMKSYSTLPTNVEPAHSNNSNNSNNRNNSNNSNNNNNQFKYFHQDIQKVLNEMNINKPTLIQEKTIPALQNGVDAYVVDETGTGKSFGVMLEIINRYYNDILNNSNKINTANNTLSNIQPKYIIISPSRELSWQFGYWSRNLLNRLNVEKSKLSKVQLAVNGIGSDELLKKELLLANPDILIGTSNVLYPLVANGFLSIDNLNMLYIDEADHIFQALKREAPKKKKMNRREHPLPSTLLFNEIKRITRENNHLYKETFEEEVINLIKSNKNNKNKNNNNNNNNNKNNNNNNNNVNNSSSKPKYIQTDRPFQTIFSSATIDNTTKKHIKDRDWINVKSQFITALNENKVQGKDIRVNKHGDYIHSDLESAPTRDQLSIINRLNHYFVTVESENQLINGIVDVWRNLKPTIALGILPNDANLTKICETIRKRNINCFTLSHAMNFQNFNLIHLPDSAEKDQLVKQSNFESKKKEFNTKREIKFREIERKKQLQQQQQQQQANNAPVEGSEIIDSNDADDEVDGEVLEAIKELEKEWKLDQLDKSSVLYLAKEDAIRGIDIEDVSHVFILNIDVKPNSYLHMIGRTARMGKTGNVVCIYNSLFTPKYLRTMNQLNIPFKEEDLY